MSSSANDGIAARLSALPFPINVFARAVEIEEGRVQELHFGLHPTPTTSAAQARGQLIELLWKHLPPPCRLLDVGIGFGDTLATLLSAGYSAAGITPDAARVEIARARHGGALPVHRVDLDAFERDRGEWDALLFLESVRDIDPLRLFTRAAQLLREDGDVIVLDEFALRRSSPGREDLHLLEHFVALAERFGFAVIGQIDLSRKAEPTLDYRQRLITRHSDALQRDLGVTPETLAGLSALASADREQYADGRRGYFLVTLRRTTRPRWRLGRIDASNADEMRTLFADVFGHAMSEAHWRWKYADERSGAIGVWEGQRLIAHYGGVARDILFFGKNQAVAQICDVMVEPAARGTLSRRGPLFLSIATYLEGHLGYGNPLLLGVGFPSLRHWKVASRLKLYGGPVGRMLELSWPVSRDRPSPFLSVRPLDLADANGQAEADACWRAMHIGLSDMIVVVRDAQSLHRRYRAHPDKTYNAYVVRHRLTGRPLGLFVLRPDAEGGCELLDVVGPLAAVPRLVAQARRMAATLGAERLILWVVDNIRAHFGSDAQARDLEILVPANAWTAGPPIDALIGRWWLTGGDTDFR